MEVGLSSRSAPYETSLVPMGCILSQGSLRFRVSVLGYPKDEALEALRLAEGNGVRALDYLKEKKQPAAPPPP